MASDVAPPDGGAQAALAPGPLVRIGCGALAVDIAPQAGGRIAQITFDDEAWLVGHDADNAAMIAWGSFPMLPWAGRVRRGRFDFDGQRLQLPLNLGMHAIHGVGFGLPWQLEEQAPARAVLSLALPTDERWPFGGHARQCIEADERRLRMTLSVTAGDRALPAVIGWHPWFRKPDRFEFQPERFYPRDGEGIACLPLAPPPPGPWDDCFIGDGPVVMHRGSQRLSLDSDCRHWVIYDQPGHATCVEPQSGPPDAFNLGLARRLEPGTSLSAEFVLTW